jgi:hypothetical protein
VDDDQPSIADRGLVDLLVDARGRADRQQILEAIGLRSNSSADLSH